VTTTPSNAYDADPATGQVPVARLSMVNMDCADPQPLAAFYAHILGWQVTYSDNDYAMITGQGATLGFGRVPGYTAPSWPDTTAGKRYHLDLQVTDPPSAAAACVALGATVPDEQPGDGRWQVLLDPAGHPFCLSPAKTAS